MRLRTVLLALAAAASLSSCLDWQGSYTAAARDQCCDIINVDERLECMRWVADNDSARRAERRRKSSDETTPNAVATNDGGIKTP